MASTIDHPLKCPKCNLTSWHNTRSICCDSCNEWFHLKCTNFTTQQFRDLSTNVEKEWVCDTCNSTCNTCAKIVNYRQNSIFCNACNKWIHLKCSGLTKVQFIDIGKNKTENWYCKICLRNNLPFF